VTEEDMMALARTWAEDEAAKKSTLMRLVGKEILLEELRRIDVPKLRDMLKDARRAAGACIAQGVGPRRSRGRWQCVSNRTAAGECP